MRVYRRLYHGLFHKVSSPVHPAVFVGCSVSCFPSPAWGCKGLAPLRSATPCPIAFPWPPLDTSRATDARSRSLSRWGKGSAPAPLRAGGRFRAIIDPSSSVVATRPARRFGGGKLAPHVCLVFCWLFVSGHPVIRLPLRVAQTEAFWCVSSGGAFISFPHRIMMKRFTQAIRVLLGKPLYLHAIDGTMLVDAPIVSEFDYTKLPPFDLAMSGALANAPPVKIVREDRFRVCVFEAKDERCDGCGKPLHWLVLELKGKNAWYHLMSMHESRLTLMQAALTEVGAYFEAQAAGRESLPLPAED